MSYFGEMMEGEKGRERFELLTKKFGIHIGKFVPYELEHVCPLCSKKIQYNEPVCIIKEPEGKNNNAINFLSFIGNTANVQKNRETVTGGWTLKQNGTTYYYPKKTDHKLIYRNWGDMFVGKKETKDPVYYLEKEIIFHYECLNNIKDILDLVKGEAILEKLGGTEDDRI